jgi:hypothetical protein
VVDANLAVIEAAYDGLLDVTGALGLIPGAEPLEPAAEAAEPALATTGGTR